MTFSVIVWLLADVMNVYFEIRGAESLRPNCVMAISGGTRPALQAYCLYSYIVEG